MRWSPTLPALEITAWLAPCLVAWIVVAAFAAGWVKTRRGWRTGDTRKLFHFAIFTCAAVLSATLGFAAVNLLGGLMALAIAFALWRGDGFPFYEAMARETDRPRRSLYIAVPFIATAIGGIASAALFGPFATVGIVASGWGDAIGEPIGIRFGKHRYRVPNFGSGVVSDRSFEGSAAVLLAVFAGTLCVFAFANLDLPTTIGWGSLAAIALAVAFASTVVEAVSHHGLDNLTMQIAATATAWCFLS